MNQVERYYAPKQLADELCNKHGLCLTADYIRAIRRRSEHDRDGLFVGGCARASELLLWMKAHPGFKRRDSAIAA